MTRQAWLDRRRSGIGGSDIAGILGMSPWATPMSVWLDKTQGSTDTGTDATSYGHEAESVVQRLFEARTGLTVVDPQREVVDAARPWRRCTLDGLVVEWGGDRMAPHSDTLDAALGIYEAKTTTGFASWADDGIPDHYRVQLEWNMGVCGLGAGWLAVWHMRPSRDGWFRTELEVLEVRPEPGVWELLQAEADRFWHDHVQAGRAPAGDGSSRTSRALQDMWTDPVPDAVALDDHPAVVEALDRLPQLRADANAAAQRLDAAEQTVKAAMGDHQAATVDGQLVATWRPSALFDHAAFAARMPRLAARYRHDTINRQALAAEWPQLAKRITREFSTPTGSRRFNPKQRKA